MKTLKGIVRALAMVALLASCGKDPKVDEHPGGGDPQIQGDVLPGEFSISQTKKVRFAKGNLKVSKVEGQYSKWEFHEHQYDFIGINNVTKPQKKSEHNYEGDDLAEVIDLFGWSATDNTNAEWGIPGALGDFNFGSSPDPETFKDWGKNIGDGKTWRTLSNEEWNYLLSRSKRNGNILCRMAKITDLSNLKVLLVASDEYVGDYLPCDRGESLEELSITKADLEKNEKLGLLCLPAVGTLNFYDNNLWNVTNIGYYWSCSLGSPQKPYQLYIASGQINTLDYYERDSSCSVRLVRDVK